MKWELHAGISASVGHKAFQVTAVPEGLQSMSALLVCAVMAYLEYNHHSCPDKAWLVCLCALVHFFVYFFIFLPATLCKDFFPPLIPLPVCCMSDRSVCVSSLNGPIVWRLR